jgi:hypothetical protein
MFKFSCSAQKGVTGLVKKKTNSGEIFEEGTSSSLKARNPSINIYFIVLVPSPPTHLFRDLIL